MMEEEEEQTHLGVLHISLLVMGSRIDLAENK